ncbi:MAG: hypothetical protein KGJ30_10995 [Burkholderiales bacterium]|nr:hypothetical protein [Burkholderiales bacterium]MDE1926231.1 hypothetical protein [Burkholderiales bacterium]MDE2159436.1 hypothetical protein [Burkholderiales bacterium]
MSRYNPERISQFRALPLFSAAATSRRLRTRATRLSGPCIALLMTACGGGGSGTAPAPAAPTYTIGGTVSGFSAGQSMVIADHGGDNLTLGSNGPFTFATPLTSGSTYAVTLVSSTAPAATKPSVCTVVNGSGTVASVNVVNINIDCVYPQYA